MYANFVEMICGSNGTVDLVKTTHISNEVTHFLNKIAKIRSRHKDWMY